MNQFEKIEKDGWQNETKQRNSSCVSFLQKYLNQSEEGGVVHYDSLSELHFSGTNRGVFDKIQEGNGIINEISTLYESGKAVQIHVVFDAEGQGHNIDVYLKGRALADYLNE